MTQAAKRSKLYILNDHTTSGMQARPSSRESTHFPLSFFFMPVTPCRCFAHVVNLANVAVMSNITKIAAIENATAIWEYDPALPDNRVLGGSLDVIACVRTVAIKVSCIFE